MDLWCSRRCSKAIAYWWKTSIVRRPMFYQRWKASSKRKRSPMGRLRLMCDFVSLSGNGKQRTTTATRVVLGIRRSSQWYGYPCAIQWIPSSSEERLLSGHSFVPSFVRSFVRSFSRRGNSSSGMTKGSFETKKIEDASFRSWRIFQSGLMIINCFRWNDFSSIRTFDRRTSSLSPVWSLEGNGGDSLCRIVVFRLLLEICGNVLVVVVCRLFRFRFPFIGNWRSPMSGMLSVLSLLILLVKVIGDRSSIGTFLNIKDE